MQKVLILGSKGMLGQELAREFSAYNFEVIGWDKEELDITNFLATEEKIKNLMPDILLNAVGYNLIEKIEQNSQIFELAKSINGEAVGNLVKVCKDNNIVFVHYSSDYVFNGHNKNGYREDDQVNPINKYGQTKAIGEKMILDTGGKFYLIRLSKLFGKSAASVDAKKSFVDTMIWLATDGGKTHLDLVDEEVGCITYAPDLAKLTRIIIEDKKPFGIYHGANSGVCSWYEWGQEVFKLKNIKIDTTPVSGDKFPRSAKVPLYSELLNTKLPPQRNWREALNEYLN